MTQRKLRFRTVVILVAIAVVGVAVFLLMGGQSSENGGVTGGGSTQNGGVTADQIKSTQPTDIVKETFSYTQPESWAKLSEQYLTGNGAASGIARISTPFAEFRVRETSAVPVDDNDLKASTIKELQKFPEFEQLGVTPTKVDGKSGQKFTYRFTGEGKGKIKQEMNVVVYKGKTYFLLFTCTDADFSKPAAEYAAILSSFKFK